MSIRRKAVVRSSGKHSQFTFNQYLEWFGTSILTVLAGTPNHRFSADRHSRLDESATAVTVLQRGFLLSPNIAPDWILKVTSLFSSINGTNLNWTESGRLPRIVVLCYGSHQLNSLKVFSLRSRTLKRIYSGLFSSLLRLIPRIFLSQQTALISSLANCILSVWPTGLTSLSELLISFQPEST